MLIVGLGNPGSQYERNRHNVGFLLLEAIANAYHISFTSKFNGAFGTGTVQGHDVMLFKPYTYMNLCGPAVSALIRFYKIPLDQVIVIHDELDLPSGKIRLKKGGGAGGHNGLRSLDAHIGNDYHRIRVGIGHPGHRDLVTGYVLGNFTNDEIANLLPLSKAFSQHLPTLLDGQFDKFQSIVAQTLIQST
ncbi:MAG: aminoacyl-tRNA hydrolase [Candidatus Nucleicultricaceae bacterium]